MPLAASAQLELYQPLQVASHQPLPFCLPNAGVIALQGFIMQVDNICLEPQEDALNAAQLDTLIDLWIQQCANRLDRAQTMPGYMGKINHFRRWWKKRGPALQWQLTRTALVEFECYLRTVPSRRNGQPLGYNTRHDVLRRLRSMFKWAYETRRTTFNYAAWVPAADGGPPEREAATLAQLQRLMTAATEDKYPLRVQALLAVLIGAGLRRQEAVSLDVETINFYADGTAKARVVGKRTKRNRTGMRWVGLDKATCTYLAAHLVALGRSQGPVFCNMNTGRRLTGEGVYKIVKAAVRAAGLEHYLEACHDLRRAFASHFAATNPGETYADILRRQLGHARFSQTTE
jgi:site-specific recombinase XerD